MPVTLKIIQMPHAKGLEPPTYQSPSAAGMDLRAACAQTDPLFLKPKMRILVPTGLIIELPEGYEGQIRPRSGLAYKHGLTCLNSPGTIDSDYRGEVQVLLINHGSETYKIERGMRIAQLVVAPVTRVAIVEGSLASTTQRGSGGFGSTGI